MIRKSLGLGAVHRAEEQPRGGIAIRYQLVVRKLEAEPIPVLVEPKPDRIARSEQLPPAGAHPLHELRKVDELHRPGGVGRRSLETVGLAERPKERVVTLRLPLELNQ